MPVNSNSRTAARLLDNRRAVRIVMAVTVVSSSGNQRPSGVGSGRLRSASHVAGVRPLSSAAAYR